MNQSEDGFTQDYDVGSVQDLYVFCRICRQVFAVRFAPPGPQARLRCPCTHEAILGEFDVFRTIQDARRHAAFYEEVYQAAKDALRTAGVPVPQSTRLSREELRRRAGLKNSGVSEVGSVRGQKPPGFQSESELLSGYGSDVSAEDSGLDRTAEYEAELADFERELRGAQRDILATHIVLSDLIAWTYVRRSKHPMFRERFLQACRQDMALAPQVIAEGRRLLKSEGRKVRLRFASFKHLYVYYRDQGQIRAAIQVAEEAAGLGLAGYREKADQLRAKR